MSHFVVLVFTRVNGRNVEELLAPYDENMLYAPYVKYTREQAIAKVRKDIEDYKNTVYARFLADKEEYKKNCWNKDHIDYLENEFPKKLEWTDEQCYQEEAMWLDKDMIGENGDLYSTYNPNSKWDWYVEGGRWDGYLPNGKNSGRVKDIKWDDDTVPFAFVTPNGMWHEKGEMLYFGIVADAKAKDTWKEEFLKFVNNCGDDVYATVIDCHI